MKNLYADLIKLLELERRCCLSDERTCVKERDYAHATKVKASRETAEWLLRELRHYRKQGEWL